MASNRVIFRELTQNEYDSIESPDTYTVYWTSDTHKIYKGNAPYGGEDVAGYQLPPATDNTLGGIIVGENLTIENGVLSAQAGGSCDDSWKEKPVILSTTEPYTYKINHVKIETSGTGYTEQESIIITAEDNTEIAAIVESVNENGGIVELLIDQDTFDTDVAGNSLEISYTEGGDGTGATVTLRTVYAPGNEPVIGTLEHTAETDPIVQTSYLHRETGQLEKNVQTLGYSSTEKRLPIKWFSSPLYQQTITIQDWTPETEVEIDIPADVIVSVEAIVIGLKETTNT